MPPKTKFLICVIGPTAVGKTELCLKLASKFGVEIISADSRQVFQQLTIGTAKPTEQELKVVKHHFIGTLHIKDDFSAGIFEKDSIELLEQLFKTYNSVMLTGGSGLYIDAVINGLEEIPDVDLNIRLELNKRFEENGLDKILDELKNVDPEYYETVEKSNPHRVIRGLEIFYSSGQKYSKFRTGIKAKRNFEVIQIGLDRPRDELYERINKRVDKMIDDGLLEEVKSVLNFKHKQALQTVGYKEIFDHLEGKHSLEEAIELIKRNTRRYAKRQMTWFRRNKEINWFHPNDEETVFNYINNKIASI
jgi:tRNA dimethylallyltransferase